MELDAAAGEVLYPSQGPFYFNIAGTLLMSAMFRAYNDGSPTSAAPIPPGSTRSF
jgi:hypothetical protein